VQDTVERSAKLVKERLSQSSCPVSGREPT
jgi:hypothetical protein